MFKLHLPNYQVDAIFADGDEPFEGNQRDYSWRTTNRERVIITEEKNKAIAKEMAELRAKQY